MLSIAALTTVTVAFAGPELVAQRDPELAPAVRLTTTDGEPIDSGAHNGHSGPRLVDFDRDGVLDLIVGTYHGRLQLYRNVGSAGEPRFADVGLLEVDGEPVKLRNW